MTRALFDDLLEKLNQDCMKMAVLTERAIDDTIVALTNKDKALALKIISLDDYIDEMQKKVEQECIDIIATQTPVAKDLRMVTAILKMTTDLERIADHATDISELIVKLLDHNEDYQFALGYMSQMAEITKRMVHNSITAFVNRDIILANETKAEDKNVNQLFDEAVSAVREWMVKDPQYISEGIRVLWIVKYFERVGDHAKNVSEWVTFHITGELY